MGIFKKLFKRKKKGDDPGYLACPVVASELKRGKYDSYSPEEPGDRESSGKPGDDAEQEKI